MKKGRSMLFLTDSQGIRLGCSGVVAGKHSDRFKIEESDFLLSKIYRIIHITPAK